MHKIRPFQKGVSRTVYPWLKRRALVVEAAWHGRRFCGMHGSDRILWIHQPNDHVIHWPASSICLPFVMNTASTN